MSRYPDESKHERDWHDFPECAQSCLLSKATGYWWRKCARSGGKCCPGAEPGIKHYDVWDCVLQKCSDEGNDYRIVQETADIFLRECAMNGYPVSVNFTMGFPEGVKGDHFPGTYEYKDFATPVQNVIINGFYGWGSLLAWAIVLLAATFTGVRPSSRSKPDRVSSTITRVFRVSRRWLWYIRRDADLLAALAVPCVAAADIRIRTQRVSFHQVFSYDDPSFVPVADGEASAVDILTIRAAIVVVNHFFIAAFALAAIPWVALFYSTGLRRGWLRQVLRTTAVSATFVWCLIATKPLYCMESHYWNDEWSGGCYVTNLFPRNAAATLRMLPGVSCGSIESKFSEMSVIFGILASLGALLMVARWDGSRKEGVAVFVVLWLAVFILCHGVFFSLPLLYNSWLGMLFVTFWYLSSNGRQCTFGPASMIRFMELDQITALAVGGSVGLASIWDSVKEFKELISSGSEAQDITQ